jgi:predicted O-linked N-acetylglucosamine transferase (SPINDLY family)
MTLTQLMDQANQMHQAGRLAEAEGLCRRILERSPKNPAALRLLKKLSPQMGKVDEAERLLRAVIAANPKQPAYHVNLGDVLAGRGQMNEALASYCRALALDPKSSQALYRLGRALNCAEPLTSGALGAYQQAIDSGTDVAEAFNLLGNSLVAMGLNEQSLAAYAEAIKLRPHDPVYHYNTGIPLKSLGRWDDSMAAYRKALELRPDYPQALNNLGILLTERNRLEESVEVLKKAVSIRPDFAAAFQNLGNSLKDLGRTDEARDALQRAIEIEPQFPLALNALGIVHLMTGNVAKAIENYRRALEVEPTSAMIHSNLLFAMSFSPDCDATAILTEAKRFYERQGMPLKHLARPHRNERDPNRRLRVGYVSPDLGQHVVGYNLLPLLRCHSPQQVEVFCYSSLTRPDATTAELRSRAHHWREVALLGDEQLADQIREDAIDILVDLSLFTAGNRLRTFSIVPAPVQITWLGYCGTSGVEGMHYRFSDPYLDPPDEDLSCYSEETIRLPETYWCYGPGGEAPKVSHLPAGERGNITFGCMNQFPKDSPAARELWWQILNRVPGSRMIIHSPPGNHLNGIREEIARHGNDNDRVEFIGRQSWDQYMRTSYRIDIGLDPFPYNGGITTCDLMWMGVPIVTLSGQTAVGRGGRSILSNIGLGELVAYSPEQYVQIAADLAGDRTRLSEIRAGLRERMQASPLVDAPRFARNVEAAYRQTWIRWCNGKSTKNSRPKPSAANQLGKK